MATSTSTLEVVIKGRDLLTPVIQKTENSLKGLGTTASGLKGSILTGIGLGAGITGFGLLTEAVQRGVDVFGNMVRGAMEEEAGMARLNVALRDAVQGWDGNTKAIEAAIQARLKFGFSDDVLRESIGTLVARTHDVNEALAAQAVAMDLARFRGIDLATATDYIGKAWDGQTAALKRAGIQIDAGVTGMEAMSSILRTVGGQYEAYATTSLGKVEAAQAKLDDSMNKLGSQTLPWVAGVFDVLASSAEGWAKAADFAGQKAGELAAALAGLIPPSAEEHLYSLSTIAQRTGGHLFDLASQAAQVPSGLHGVDIAADRTTAAMGRMAAMTAQAWAELRRLTIASTSHEWNLEIAPNGITVPRGYKNQGWDAILSQRETLAQEAAARAAASEAAGRKAAAEALDRQNAAIQRYIDSIKRLDDAQQTLFERMIANLDAVINKQLDAIDAARAQRDEARQQQQDQRDLVAAIKALQEAAKSGSAEQIISAQQNLADVRARIEEEQTRKHEDELKKRLEETKAYIDSVAQLESSATNRKALANTLQKREDVLKTQQAAAAAAGDTETVNLIQMKLDAIRAAEDRNAQAMDNAAKTATAQQFMTVHTVINLDGKTIAEVVDKYLGRKK